MSKVTPANHFKKQHKKAERDPRWHGIFHGGVPFPGDHRSPWEYVINCFLNDKPIPDYFYEYSIILIARQESQIKNRLGSLSQVGIKGLDLHSDGYGGDHLLLYIRTNQGTVYLVGIRTHSGLF